MRIRPGAPRLTATETSPRDTTVPSSPPQTKTPTNEGTKMKDVDTAKLLHALRGGEDPTTALTDPGHGAITTADGRTISQSEIAARILKAAPWLTTGMAMQRAADVVDATRAATRRARPKPNTGPTFSIRARAQEIQRERGGLIGEAMLIAEAEIRAAKAATTTAPATESGGQRVSLRELSHRIAAARGVTLGEAQRIAEQMANRRRRRRARAHARGATSRARPSAEAQRSRPRIRPLRGGVRRTRDRRG